jgi:hypothetical protein
LFAKLDFRLKGVDFVLKLGREFSIQKGAPKCVAGFHDRSPWSLMYSGRSKRLFAGLPEGLICLNSTDYNTRMTLGK